MLPYVHMQFVYYYLHEYTIAILPFLSDFSPDQSELPFFLTKLFFCISVWLYLNFIFIGVAGSLFFISMLMAVKRYRIKLMYMYTCIYHVCKKLTDKLTATLICYQNGH